MRVFLEHLQKGTIPHDMVEEFRKSDVQYYDGWLIVRVVDHKSVAHAAAASGSATDDEKPFSIHNYNQYITPSPYGPYPSKEHAVARSPPMKQEHRASMSTHLKDGLHSDDTMDVLPKSNWPQPKIYHVALRPTILSRHMDLVVDAMTPDPKAINRKQSQANVNGRTPASAAPSTPMSGMPPTPSTEKGPPLKRQKMKIDAKDLLEYEARIVNSTAPPVYLDPVESLAEAESVITMLKDPLHDAAPPSPKSRKRTVAELAADDAHAKEQERFMLIMDERNVGMTTAANAGGVDGQAGAALFQPRFEKFNTLDNIKRDIADRKQRESDRQLQEEENRRGAQERMQEEEKKRILMKRQQEAHMRAMQQQQQQQAQALQRQHQANGIPPQMQNQMIAAAQQRSSPVIRQSTPHTASSPVVNHGTGGHGMAVSGSQQGHGSPPRPGSAVQHAHPTVPMTRAPSGQGPSRNGTPQIPQRTPSVRNATPVMRQPTPAQPMAQTSPHGSMVALTPQMTTAMMPGQMPNGISGIRQPLNAQQAAELHRRQIMQQQVLQQQMVNGTPQMSPAQIAQFQAHQAAQADRQAAIQRHQAQQQAAMQQQGTPRVQHMSPSPAQSQNAYKQQIAEQMKAQMQQNQAHNSPAPHHLTPQQQAAQQRMMQQQQAQMAGGIPHPQQQRPPGNPVLQQFYQTTLNAYTQRFLNQASAKYGGNAGMLQPQEMEQVQHQAKAAAIQAMRKRQAEMNQAQMQQAQMRQQAQQAGMPNAMNMNVTPNMAAALQQQQAQQIQQMQMQHAQAQMMAQQQQHQQQQGAMAGMHQYQQQLQNMQQQR